MYYRGWLNVSSSVMQTSDGTAEGLRWDHTELVPSIEEVQKALKLFKPDKAVGPDRIPSDLACF